MVIRGRMSKTLCQDETLNMRRIGPAKISDSLEQPHGQHGNVVAEALGVNPEFGLTSGEAALRLERDGKNVLTQESGPAWWKVLLRQFSSVVVWLLLAAALIAWLSGSALETAAILTVLLLNAWIGFATEWKAGRALAALRRETGTMVRVRRDGRETIIDASGLVAGDVIVLTAGDRVPADARLLEDSTFRTDESTFTGESLPVEKSSEPVPFASILAERRSMAYLGTMVVAGRAVAIVTATGTYTEIGRIGRLIAETESEKTPLEHRLESLGKILVYIVLGIALVVMLSGVMRGDDPWMMMKVSISLAVAAVPESLPAMTTLILALGVLRMAAHRAIVRKLAAVETLGSATVICTDKTGTLTENRMTVQEYRLANGQSPAATARAEVDSNLTKLLHVSVLCNDAVFDSSRAEQLAVGDPTETALLIAARDFGVDVSDVRREFLRIFEEPFDAATKRMITVFQKDPDGSAFAAIKGGPNAVLGTCGSFHKDSGEIAALNDPERERFLEINNEMAARGLRVLAFAYKDLQNRFDPSLLVDLEHDYVFLGFVGMSDPLREGAAEAIRRAHEAGIRVVMLTGDQVITARAIAHQLNLSRDGDMFAMHSREIADAGNKSLADAVRRAHVFARVSPEDKLRIVEALQQMGEVVAVTGDGINDAPALKRSDIGIAMGQRGTDVAKEASDVILTDDNFSTIITAIEGGRSIYSNITKFVHFLFTANFGEVAFIFASMIVGLPLPLLPLQILWINLVTDVFPAFALAVEPSSQETMRRPPRHPQEELLSTRFLILIGWQGAMLATVAFAAYLWSLSVYGEGPHARTLAFLALVGVQIGHLFNCRSRTRSAAREFFKNPWIHIAVGITIFLQIAAIYFDPLADVLGLVETVPSDWLIIVVCIILPVLLVEIIKAIRRRQLRV